MYPLEIRIPLKVRQDQRIKLKITDGGGGLLPVYTGETEITPKTVPQIVETKNKSVLSDINVLGIPYFETSNPKGMTAIIGGNG